MSTSKNMGKLFSALVLGGSMMAQADDSGLKIEEVQEVEAICQVAMTKTTYQMNFESKQETTCLDQKTDEEVLKIVNDAKEESCISPFCGCWLG